MRPRSTYSSIKNGASLFPCLQYADHAMNKAFTNTIIKVYGAKRAQHPHLIRHFQDILITYNQAFYPYSLFENVYKKPNGLAHIKLFLTLLQELPAELSFLMFSATNFFESRLRNLLNFTSIYNALSALTEIKIREIMHGNVKYQNMSNDLQDLFIEILFTIKVNMKFDFERLFQQRNEPSITFFVEAQTKPEHFGLTLDQAIAFTQELDKALQDEFAVMMMNYLIAMVSNYQGLPPPRQNAEAFKNILLEVKNKKSPLAFYNQQLGFPLGRKELRIILEKGFQPKLDRGLNVEQADKPKYFLVLTGKFYPEFFDARLTKTSAIEAVNKIIPHISSRKCLIEEKLIQFQVLFALTECYANSHTYPVLDDILGINNTLTWQRLMSQIRSAAFTQLTVENNYLQPREASHYLAVLKLAVKLPLFNQHRGNYSDFFGIGGKTSTVEKIEELIKQAVRPREMFSYR